MQAFHEVIDLLFPHFCLVCGRRLGQSLLCSGCLPLQPVLDAPTRCTCCFSLTPDLDACGRCTLCRLYPLPFQRMRFLWSYEGQARDLISTIKYRPSFRLGKITAAHAATLFEPILHSGSWDLIVPTPTSRHSLWSRPFNLCLLLAKALQDSSPGAGVVSDSALLHHGCRAPQASLRPRERLRNVRHSFSARAHEVEGKSILLVDDVITTGATSAAAARALLLAGAAEVDLIALARASTWEQYRMKLYQE